MVIDKILNLILKIAVMILLIMIMIMRAIEDKPMNGNSLNDKNEVESGIKIIRIVLLW